MRVTFNCSTKLMVDWNEVSTGQLQPEKQWGGQILLHVTARSDSQDLREGTRISLQCSAQLLDRQWKKQSLSGLPCRSSKPQKKRQVHSSSYFLSVDAEKKKVVCNRDDLFTK